MQVLLDYLPADGVPVATATSHVLLCLTLPSCAEHKLEKEVPFCRLTAGWASCSAKDAPAVPSPFHTAERQDASWLQLRGFKPRSLPQPSWTEEDKALFRQGLTQYARKENVPDESMDRVHYLQHHLMQCEYSKKDCMRTLRSEKRLMRSRGDIPQEICVDGMSTDSDEGSAHGDDDSVAA